MTYIIENASLLRNQKLVQASVLIENNQIASIKPSFKKYSYIKMDGDPYIMTPTQVLLLSNIPLNKSFLEQKNFFVNKFILKGCTSFLTFIEIPYEHMLKTKIKTLKMSLLNSPIDYIIGIKIRKNVLNANFLRKCKKEKIPAIFVEIFNEKEIFDIPWGWIKEAMFPYNSPLIPIISIENDREKKRVEMIWKEKMKQESIPSIKEELLEGEPISYRNLSKMGVIPLKGNIQQGGEVSYNFYMKSREIRNVEEYQLFHYHYHRLQITVHKGEVIRAGNYVCYRPGFGEHVDIKKPFFYSPNDY